MYRRFFKPLGDRLLAMAGLILLSPLIALIALTIRLSMGKSVLFRQQRIGLEDEPFTFLKFRTMTAQRDELGRLLPDGNRLTPFGRLLRASSLDELPQLWNVLRGDMSLIGPRPLLPQYLPRYSPFQRRRHAVKPGITGWAQVKGRNSLAWAEKFELDVWYVDHCSLAVDLKIWAMTFLRVFTASGIAMSGHATMPEFMGNSESPRQAGG